MDIFKRSMTKESLTRLLSLAFDCGQQASYELKYENVDELILNFQKEGEWLILPVEVLKQLPNGQKIYHTLFGTGIITNWAEDKIVQFQGFKFGLKEDGFPWNFRLQLC
jgi:hypothetical protein